MKNVLKVVFVIIGTIIGAGFASRERNISILLYVWDKWSNGNNNIININRNNNI